MSDFALLLERSQAFEDHLLSVHGGVQAATDDPRVHAARNAAHLAVEHAHAVRLLFETVMPNAACALLRAQYEGVVRAAWALYAASGDQVEKLNLPLDLEAEQGAKNLPGAGDMLRALKARAGLQPELLGLVTPLVEIHTHHWRAMNSFVHGGIHPLQRKSTGFPLPLAESLVRISNGILYFAFRLLVRLGDQPSVVVEMERAWRGFEDCCPMASRSA